MKAVLPVAAVLLGVLLLLASAVWPTLFPPTRSWTDQKSEQLSELGAKTNRLKFALVEANNNPSMHSGRNAAEIQAEYDAVRGEYDKLHDEFASARDAPQATSAALRWLGISLIAVGATAVLVLRNATG